MNLAEICMAEVNHHNGYPKAEYEIFVIYENRAREAAQKGETSLDICCRQSHDEMIEKIRS